MALDDLEGVLHRGDPVPDRLRINDDGGPLGALVETSGCIGPHFSLKASFFNLFFKKFANGLRTFGGAAAPGVGRVPLVGADKDVFFKEGHKKPITPIYSTPSQKGCKEGLSPPSMDFDPYFLRVFYDLGLENAHRKLFHGKVLK